MPNAAHLTSQADIDVENQHIAISASWTLKGSIPWMQSMRNL
jgi:hypothetical protein